MELKRCRTCKVEKTLAEFGKYRTQSDGLNKVCRDCCRIRNKRFRTPEMLKKYGRRVAAKKLREKSATLSLTSRCNVCGLKFTYESKATYPHWDHDHGTGAGRGWLCSKCNAGIGLLGDNPALLKRAAEYLTERGHYTTRTVIR